MFCALFRPRSWIAALLLLAQVAAMGQASLSVYTDRLVNGFQDWSWGTHSLTNPSPVYFGTNSIRYSGNDWEAISFYHPDLNTALYGSFAFWVNGGASGGQRLQVYAECGGTNGPTHIIPGTLPANTWQLIAIPLTTLGMADVPNFNRITIQFRSDGSSSAYYLDEVLFAPKPAPAIVNVTVDATQILQVANERHFGVNLAMWDSHYDPPHHTTTTALLQEMGCTVVRMPGGSLSDEYHWASNTTLTNTWQWVASFSDMVRVATNAGVQAFITVNYGTGTPEEAGAWVRHANVTNQLGYKYWEIGNECYGTWETDANIHPHSAHTYATRAAQYIAQMRAADPTIKIGVVSVPGEDASSNGYTDHPALNLRTGETHYGWTPVMLSTLKALGVMPDFLVHHHYPQWTDRDNPGQSNDNDVNLLHSTGNWALDAANLRRQLTDYFGSGGTNIELVVTENNSDAGAQGRQSTSLINGLYYADSLNRLLKTEFQGFVWWDMRNGTDTGGYFGSDIYGWRTYGDLGMINGPSTRHPTFYAAKLMQWFARPGDRILEASTDYDWLAAYAARRANGAVTLLVLNKSLITQLNANVSLNGFAPDVKASVRSYGIPQDEAARTNAPLALQDIALSELAGIDTSFSHSFPPLSMTLLTLAPAAPSLQVLPGADEDQVVVQLSGQSDVPYVLQTSANLLNWISVATNTMTGSTLNLTNAVSGSGVGKFWRAVWQP